MFTAKRIRTMDAGRPLATMNCWLEREEHEIDASFEGQVILPGFIDSHRHLQASGVLMA